MALDQDLANLHRVQRAIGFAASAAVTIVGCASRSAMGEMPMSGGWTISMAWMRQPSFGSPR